MNKSQRWACILCPGVALLLVLAIAAGCGSAEQETSTPTEISVEAPQPTETTIMQEIPGEVVVDEESLVDSEPPPQDEQPEPSPVPEEMELYIKGQVIISGPADQVDAAVSILGDMNLLETQLRRLNLQEADINPSECDTIKDHLTILPECFEDGEPWVLDLLQLDDSGPAAVLEAVHALDPLDPEEFPCVFLHPNYLVGDPWTGDGSPWTGVGSPWTGVGSPWTGVGSSLPGTAAIPALQAEFEQQWAFESISLTKPSGDRQQVDVTGEGIRLGVFDTSPFSLDEGNGPSPEFIHWAVEPFTLTVHHPQFLSPLPAPTDTQDITPTLANHGLFVAGLAHQVAPDSEIHLYRVLDEYVQGDLFTMDAAILNFITETLAVGDNSQGAVINLSLGIHPGVDQEGLDLPPEVMALELLLAGARCQGMAVVAAAGNDRASYDEPAPPPHIPARYEFVLGVAASNYGKAPSCFSNQGQVAAPGGDGEDGEDECTLCSPGNCAALSLISMVLEQPGYAYWSGTSFAGPLASGQAALLLSSGVDPFDVHNRIMTTTLRIQGEDLAGDVVDYGIINLPSSLP